MYLKNMLIFFWIFYGLIFNGSKTFEPLNLNSEVKVMRNFILWTM